MNDTIFEQVVYKKMTFKDRLPYLLMLIGMVLFCLISVLFLGSFSFVLMVILFFVAYYQIFPRFNTEFEYTLFNDEFEISVIYGKEKRKSKAILNLQDAKCIAPSGAEQLDYYRTGKTVDFSSGMEGKKTYEIIANDGGTLCSYIIEPNEEMTKHMKRAARNNMFIDLY